MTACRMTHNCRWWFPVLVNQKFVSTKVLFSMATMLWAFSNSHKCPAMNCMIFNNFVLPVSGGWQYKQISGLSLACQCSSCTQLSCSQEVNYYSLEVYSTNYDSRFVMVGGWGCRGAHCNKQWTLFTVKQGGSLC